MNYGEIPEVTVIYLAVSVILLPPELNSIAFHKTFKDFFLTFPVTAGFVALFLQLLFWYF